MADVRILKTDNINKVPIKANQLIFCKNSSFYFDYDDHTRLRNVGVGTQLADFKPNTVYDKDDIVIYDGFIYRCKEPFTSLLCFDMKNWEKIGFGLDTPTEIGPAALISYDNTSSELTAADVQAAIDEIWFSILSVELYIGEI